jgi:hypothetical protein
LPFDLATATRTDQASLKEWGRVKGVQRGFVEVVEL